MSDLSNVLVQFNDDFSIVIFHYFCLLSRQPTKQKNLLDINNDKRWMEHIFLLSEFLCVYFFHNNAKCDSLTAAAADECVELKIRRNWSHIWNFEWGHHHKYMRAKRYDKKKLIQTKIFHFSTHKLNKDSIERNYIEIGQELVVRNSGSVERKYQTLIIIFAHFRDDDDESSQNGPSLTLPSRLV